MEICHRMAPHHHRLRRALQTDCDEKGSNGSAVWAQLKIAEQQEIKTNNAGDGQGGKKVLLNGCN